MSACVRSDTTPSSSPPRPDTAAQLDDDELFPIDELVPMAALAALPVAAQDAPLTQPAWRPRLAPRALTGIAASAALYAGLALAMDRGRATEQRSLAPSWRSGSAEPRPSVGQRNAPRRRTHRRVPRRSQIVPSPRPRSTALPRRPVTRAIARPTPMPAERDAAHSAPAPAPRPSPGCEFEPSCAGPGERP